MTPDRNEPPMSALDTPLNDQELDTLDDVLYQRLPEEPAGQTEDEGITSVSALDGFLVALISGPEVIEPSAWLPLLWGDFEPQWEGPQEAEAVMALVLRHMNALVDTLTRHPEQFEPIVLQREEEGESVTVVEEWCRGYVRGISLAADAWRSGGEGVMELLFPITIFANDKRSEMLAGLSDEEVEALKRSLPATVNKVHAFWQQAAQPFMHDVPPPGRNDPCPCGSGRKFKKCCLH